MGCIVIIVCGLMVVFFWGFAWWAGVIALVLCLIGLFSAATGNY